MFHPSTNMNKTILGLGVGHLVVIVIAIVVLGGTFFTKHNPLAKNDGVYCSQDGTLSDEQSIQSHRSYCLKTNSEEVAFTSTTPASYSFSIVDDEGNAVKDFAITHTKPMHVIVVRKDLANFQHVHPEFDEATGSFTLSNLSFPTDGNYRIFADFAPESAMRDPMGMPLPVTISEDVKVGSGNSTSPIGSEERSKTFNDNQIVLSTTPANLVSGSEAMLTFDLKQNGRAITDLEEYLGAMGHAVVLKEGTLDFIHAHPMEKTAQDGKVEFMLTFPTAGKYKVFTQFQRSGNVFTTDFVVSVAQGTPGLDSGVDHSMH
jgi:hypothetical protein